VKYRQIFSKNIFLVLALSAVSLTIFGMYLVKNYRDFMTAGGLLSVTVNVIVLLALLDFLVYRVFKNTK